MPVPWWRWRCFSRPLRYGARFWWESNYGRAVRTASNAGVVARDYRCGANRRGNRIVDRRAAGNPVIRLRVYIDGELRLDEPARAPDIDQLARAVDDLESDCLAYNR